LAVWGLIKVLILRTASQANCTGLLRRHSRNNAWGQSLLPRLKCALHRAVGQPHRGCDLTNAAAGLFQRPDLGAVHSYAGAAQRLAGRFGAAEGRLGGVQAGERGPLWRSLRASACAGLQYAAYRRSADAHLFRDFTRRHTVRVHFSYLGAVHHKPRPAADPAGPACAL
jgi:hypothetical protein